MNSTFINRLQNYLLSLASVAAVITIAAVSIGLLYQFFQFIETTAKASARVAGEYISHIH